VERLNDISEEDCKLEGIEIYNTFVDDDTNKPTNYYQLHKSKKEKKSDWDYFFNYVAFGTHNSWTEESRATITVFISHNIKIAYQTLFDSINGKGKYATNPLVYVYEYKRYD
jgi:hypothetical protein